MKIYFRWDWMFRWLGWLIDLPFVDKLIYQSQDKKDIHILHGNKGHE